MSNNRNLEQIKKTTSNSVILSSDHLQVRTIYIFSLELLLCPKFSYYRLTGSGWNSVELDLSPQLTLKGRIFTSNLNGTTGLHPLVKKQNYTKSVLNCLSNRTTYARKITVVLRTSSFFWSRSISRR